jgi:hypothetical protein
VFFVSISIWQKRFYISDIKLKTTKKTNFTTFSIFLFFPCHVWHYFKLLFNKTWRKVEKSKLLLHIEVRQQKENCNRKVENRFTCRVTCLIHFWKQWDLRKVTIFTNKTLRTCEMPIFFLHKHSKDELKKNLLCFPKVKLFSVYKETKK